MVTMVTIFDKRWNFNVTGCDQKNPKWSQKMQSLMYQGFRGGHL